MKALVIGILVTVATAARAQTMLDQEQRLIEVHSLLIAVPALNAPGAYAFREGSVGLELITIPTINGQTGGRVQRTASDRTPLFPRLRLAMGLPAPEGFRATLGIGYIPPIEFKQVSSHFGSIEAELAYAPGPLAVGLRGHALAARSQSPVTDPVIRDTLDTIEYGASLSAGYQFDISGLSITPYAGVGLTRVASDFTVTSDGYSLSSRTVNPSVSGGARVFWNRFEAVGELVAFPGRLVHPSFRIAYAPRF